MVGTIKLFEILKTRFSDEEARFVVEEIEKIEASVEAKVDKEFDKKSLLFKEDIKSLKEYMDHVFATKEDVVKVKAEIIKWMFIFWIGQLASFVAIAMLIFRK